jgi:hypothetical protein
MRSADDWLNIKQEACRSENDGILDFDRRNSRFAVISVTGRWHSANCLAGVVDPSGRYFEMRLSITSLIGRSEK